MSRVVWIIALAGGIAGVGGFLIGNSGGRPGNSPDVSGESGSASVERIRELVDPRDISQLRPEVAAELEAAQALVAAGDPRGALRMAVSIRDEVRRAEVLFALVTQLDAELMSAMMPQVFAEEGRDEQDEDLIDELADAGFALFALLDRWAEVDPEGIEAHLLGFETVPDRGSLANMRALQLMSLAFRDPDRAKVLLEKIQVDPVDKDSERYSRKLRDFFIAGVSASDPAGALRILRESGLEFDDYSYVDGLFQLPGARIGEMFEGIMQLPAGEGRSRGIEDFFHVWSKNDPAAAAVAARSLGEEDGRERVLSDVVENFARIDPLAARDYLSSLPEGEERDQLRGELAHLWVREGDPSAALEWAEENFDQATYFDVLNNGMSQLSSEVGMRVISGLSSESREAFFEGRKGSDAIDGFLDRAASADALGTFTWLNEVGGFDPGSRVGRDFGLHAAEQDLEGALALADSLPPGRFRDEYLEQVARIGGRDDPELAFQWATRTDPEWREQSASRVLEAWILEDPNEAATFAQGVGEEAVATVVDGWAAIDAAGAYRWIFETEGGNPEAMAELLDQNGVIDSWVREDAAAAAEAMTGFPEDLAPARVADVIGRWSAEAPRRASEFISDRLESGPVRDAAVVALIEQLRAADPESASIWAQSIADPELRESVLDSFPVE